MAKFCNCGVSTLVASFLLLVIFTIVIIFNEYLNVNLNKTELIQNYYTTYNTTNKWIQSLIGLDIDTQTQDIGNIENTKNTKNTESTENTENTKNTESTENIENTQNIENIENIKNIENIENTENIEFVERFNISYDREQKCLSRTDEYEYPLQWKNFSDPIIIWEWNYSSNYIDINPVYSIIVNIFDSLNVAERVIESILKLSRGSYELIVVFDAVDDECIDSIMNLVRNKWIKNKNKDCSLKYFENDKSMKHEYLKQSCLIYKYCINYKHKIKWLAECGELQRILFIRSWGIWETSANNLGMCLSSKMTKYYIHLQDDMQMTQIGWNINIILPLLIFNNDIFSVSARCATPIQNVFRSKLAAITTQQWQFMDVDIARSHGNIINNKKRTPSPIGRCGTDIDKPLNIKKINISKVYERSNSNRGPFAVNASNMRFLHFWNEKYFKLIFDIGELHLRSMTYLYKHSSFFPLQFRADLNWGGSRRKRRKKTNSEMIKKKLYENFRNNRRDKNNAFLNTGKHKKIANYNGERIITNSMIQKFDQLFNFCQT